MFYRCKCLKNFNGQLNQSCSVLTTAGYTVARGEEREEGGGGSLLSHMTVKRDNSV